MTGYDIPASELFSQGLDAVKYGLDRSQMEIIHCLRDFVSEYNRELPMATERPVDSPAEAAQLIYPRLRGLQKEEVWCVFLNRANMPLYSEMTSSGSLTASLIDPRQIVRSALERNACGVILYHNHPSGNPRPSASDVKETERLRECLKVFEISLVDHIVISDSSYYSFAGNEVSKYNF